MADAAKSSRSIPGDRRDDFRAGGGSGLQLVSLFRGDLREKVLSYASASDLCKLDAVCKQIHGLTAGRWTEVAEERFGMKNGKEGWKMGTALLRKPVYINIHKDQRAEPHIEHDDVYYSDFVNAAAQNSVFAIETNCTPGGIDVWNGESLVYENSRSRGDITGYRKVAVAGLTGNELFVSAGHSELEFRRDGFRKRYHFPREVDDDFNGISAVGSDAHVVAVHGNFVRLYRVTQDDELVTSCHSEVLKRSFQMEHGEEFHSCVSWGSDNSEVVIAHSLLKDDWEETYRASEIIVWSLAADTNSLSYVQTIEAGIGLETVAMSKDFVVGASLDRKIHVWDRRTGEKKPYVLCDAEAGDQLTPQEIACSLCLSFHGHMLVSTSRLGCALCIWNIKTGKLIKRYNHPEQRGLVELQQPIGPKLVYLRPLNGFICVVRSLNVWTFPTCQSQEYMARVIEAREQLCRTRSGS